MVLLLVYCLNILQKSVAFSLEMSSFEAYARNDSGTHYSTSVFLILIVFRMVFPKMSSTFV